MGEWYFASENLLPGSSVSRTLVENGLIRIERTLKTRPLTYLSDNNNYEAIATSHLLYGRSININFMYFDPEYCEQENTLLKKYKRLKIILEYVIEKI